MPSVTDWSRPPHTRQSPAHGELAGTPCPEAAQSPGSPRAVRRYSVAEESATFGRNVTVNELLWPYSIVPGVLVDRKKFVGSPRPVRELTVSGCSAMFCTQNV